ncbi:MAG: HAMP domain-containing histidine kinase [Solirubrobacterales bacterium]|nr:HAMP domain-containing histidine kinase [Solirubrobacterales bacterium]
MRLPGRGALGLRGRIVGAVVVTALATLAVAAVALLGPLENSLRHAEVAALRHDLGASTKSSFEHLPAIDDPDLHSREALHRLQVRTGNRIGGALVGVYGYPGRGGYDSTAPYGHPVAQSESQAARAKAFTTERPNFGYVTIEDHEYALAAIPFTNANQYWVLVVIKPIDEIADAVGVVRRAFLDASLAGLALTLILGIPLAATLVRRLRRLREAALLLADGGPGGQVPVDRARDEVGDLARTLASMQKRLIVQEEARRAFVATASHELRTPLTSLDGMLELLNEDLHDPEPDLDDARALLERARAQSRRLGRLAADLLDLSRIDAQVELRSEPVELGELSRAVVAEFELGTEERGVRSELEDLDGSVWALGDPGSIARILRILLDNAVQVSPRGAEVRVILRCTPEVAISVCDEGPGVAEEDREAIFSRFRRGQNTAGQAGFGLGLAIGRELAERMGGTLVLDGTGDHGARFTLRLPRAPAADHDPVAVA